MEKRGKEIVLLVLAAVLVAVAAVTLFRRSGPPPKTPIADQAQEEKVADKSAKDDLPTPQALLGGSPGTSPGRNPFSQPAGGGPPKAPAAPAEPAPSPGDEPGAALPPLVPPGGVGPLPSDLAPDVLHLKGVIRGKKTLAVLRKGETRYFVSRGDKVEGNYVVTYIGTNSVTLKSKEGDKINLILGGGR